MAKPQNEPCLATPLDPNYLSSLARSNWFLIKTKWAFNKQCCFSSKWLFVMNLIQWLAIVRHTEKWIKHKQMKWTLNWTHLCRSLSIACTSRLECLRKNLISSLSVDHFKMLRIIIIGLKPFLWITIILFIIIYIYRTLKSKHWKREKER